MYKINFENTQGAFTKAKIYHYNQLPIIVPSKEQENQVKELVEKILEKKGVSTESEENGIDKILYEVYDLSEEDIKTVEENQ